MADEIIEKNIHRTNLKRLAHTLCLLLPIAAAFGGYFLSEPLWAIKKGGIETPELFKFAVSLTTFAITTLVIFIFTRKADPIIKIRIFSK